MASQHILLPYEGTPRQCLLLKAACDLAKRRRAELTVVCVVEVPLSLSINAPDLPGIAEANRLLDEAEALVSRSGVRIATRVYPCRDAGHAIVVLSQRLGCSLVIMEAEDSHSPREGTSVFGPAVEHVVAHAPCEVWISRIAQID